MLTAKDPTNVTREDIIPLSLYAERRKTMYYPIMREAKRVRRVHIGPHASICFENYDLNWIQIHEMLFIERGGEAQIHDELTAYNALIPKGHELIATLMFEIDDPVKRARQLSKMGRVEEHIFLEFGHTRIKAVPAQDEAGIERTTADGKTSAIHFLRFPFNGEDKKSFLESNPHKTPVRLFIEHPEYPHGIKLGSDLVDECKKDLQLLS